MLHQTDTELPYMYGVSKHTAVLLLQERICTLRLSPTALSKLEIWFAGLYRLAPIPPNFLACSTQLYDRVTCLCGMCCSLSSSTAEQGQIFEAGLDLKVQGRHAKLL